MPFNVLNHALASPPCGSQTFCWRWRALLRDDCLRLRRQGDGERAVAGRAEVPKNATYYAGLVAGLAATAAATFVVTRAARRALSEV
jgi:hypothetical protein